MLRPSRTTAPGVGLARTGGRGQRRVIAAGHVSLDDGTGIVHIAPAFGGEDFEDGKRHGFLFAQPINRHGTMAAYLPGEGKFAKDADEASSATSRSAG